MSLESGVAPTNVLWIVADELRWDALGCYGAQVHHTPHLDRLAREGALFASAYVNGPECVPSRASFMTGKYCKTVGVFNNAMALNFTPERREAALEIKEQMGPDAWERRVGLMVDAFSTKQSSYSYPMPSSMLSPLLDQLMLRKAAEEAGAYDDGPIDRMLPELLAEHGYRTRNAGKLHHNDRWSGFQEVFQHPDEDLHTPLGVLTTEATLDEERLVFLPTNEVVRVIAGGVWPLPEERNPDARRAQDIVEFLATADRAQPWLARLSMIWPHTPVLPPEPWDQQFDPADFPLAPMPTEAELAQKSQYERGWRERSWSGSLTQAQLRRAWSDYWGLSGYVDELVGRVLTALDASPFADDTLVIFTSDHGTLMGEHGLWQKESFYEPVVKVPLLMRLPGRIPAGTRIEAPVELVDIVPTVLDYAGLPIPGDVEGVSLKPTIEGRVRRPHEYAFSEYVNNGAESDGWVRRMVSDDEWRLEVTLPNLDGDLDAVLYHLPSDPDELTNRWADPGASADGERLLEVLHDWVGGAARHHLATTS